MYHSSGVANICSLAHLDNDHLWCLRAGDNSHANALGTFLPPRIFYSVLLTALLLF